MNSIKTLILIGVTALVSTMAISAGAAMPLQRGWYLEGNVGTSNLNDIDYGPGTSTTNQNSGLTWNINGGYQFFPYFALELGYTRFSTFDIEFKEATVAKNESYDYDLTTKAILPIQDSGFNLYAKVGVARVSSKIVINDQQTIDENGLDISSGYTYNTGILYGIGGEYYFTPTTAVHAVWTEINASNTTGNLSTIAAGVSHIFG